MHILASYSKFYVITKHFVPDITKRILESDERCFIAVGDITTPLSESPLLSRNITQYLSERFFLCLLKYEEYKRLYRREALFTITISANVTHSFFITPYQPASTRVARGSVQKDQSGIK
jgi:hypothetical protein